MTRNHLYLLMLASSSLTVGLNSCQIVKHSAEPMALDDVNFSDDQGQLPKVKFDHKTLNEQMLLWQASNVKNYQYYFSAIGYFPYFGTIIVENGIYKNDLPADDSFGINSHLCYSTIDKMYKTIEKVFSSYNNNAESSKSDVHLTEIVVEYDTVNHIPIKIKYEYNFPPNIVVDGTFSYEIKDFKPGP